MSQVSRFTLSGFLFGLLLFGSVTSMTLTFAGDMFNTYGQNVDDSALTQSAEDINQRVNSRINNSQQQAENVGGGIAANLFFIEAIWNVIDITLGSLPLATNILTDLALAMNLPLELISLISGFVVIGVIYAIVRLYQGGVA